MRTARGVVATALAAGVAISAAAQAPSPPPPPQGAGRSDPSFTQPSIAPGVDYTVPTEAEVTRALGRIRGAISIAVTAGQRCRC